MRSSTVLWLWRRFSAELVGVFAVVGASVGVGGNLRSVGLHGESAAQEIGVRIALGAQRNEYSQADPDSGALLAGVGVCVGLTLAAGTAAR